VAVPVISSSEVAAVIAPAEAAAAVLSPAQVAAVGLTCAPVVVVRLTSAAVAAAGAAPASVAPAVISPAPVAAQVLTRSVMKISQMAAPHETPILISMPVVSPPKVGAPIVTPAPETETVPMVTTAAMAAVSTPSVTPAAVAAAVGTPAAMRAPVVPPVAVAEVSTLAALAPPFGEAVTVTRVDGSTSSGPHSVIKITAAALSISVAAVVAPDVNTSAVATPAVNAAPVAAAVLPASTPAVATPSVVSFSAVASATTDSTVASGGPGMGTAACVNPAVRGSAAFVALMEASGAAVRAQEHAVNKNRTVTMQRLGRYINAVNGYSVSSKTLEEAAAMIASASAMEDSNEDLQVVIHLSGVSAIGNLSWKSLFGQGAYVDPDVLRVFGQAHQFCRGRDVLARARLSADAEARLVGTLHRGQSAIPTSSSPTPIAATAEDEEILEAFTPPVDSILPPHVSIQRLAHVVARARSASPPGRFSVGSAAHSSTVSDGRAASGGDSDGAQLAGVGILCVLENIPPPALVTPIKSAVDLIKGVFFNRRVLKRSGDRGWGTTVKWLSGLSLYVCVRTCFVGCLSKAPLFPSRALLK